MEFFCLARFARVRKGHRERRSFFRAAVEKDGSPNRLRPPAVVRGNVRMVFHCRPLSGNEKRAFSL